MNLEDLKVFLAVAEASGVTRAAPYLGRVPSNVSTRIASLERSLGVTLFYRSNSGMSLTGEGEALRRHAQTVFRAVEGAVAAVGTLCQPALLRLGIVPSIGLPQITDALASFAASSPRTEIQLQHGPSRELQARVAGGELDGAFVDTVHNITGLQSLEIGREVLVLAGPRSWNGRPPPRAVSLGPGDAYKERADAWYESQGALPLSHVAAPTIDFALNCISAGAAIGILPASVLVKQDCTDQLAVRQLPPPLDTLPISFVFSTRSVPRALLPFLPTSRTEGNSGAKSSDEFQSQQRS